MTPDRIGAALWIFMFLSPIVTIPFVWVTMKGAGKAFKIFIGLLLALLLSLICYVVSLGIIFRNGIGP